MAECVSFRDDLLTRIVYVTHPDSSAWETRPREDALRLTWARISTWLTSGRAERRLELAAGNTIPARCSTTVHSSAGGKTATECEGENKYI